MYRIGVCMSLGACEGLGVGAITDFGAFEGSFTCEDCPSSFLSHCIRSLCVLSTHI